MEYQLRDYRIQPGAMALWLSEWRAHIYPLRERLGFKVVGAWTVEETDRFVWILGWDGPGTYEDADRAYYQSPDRKAIQPNPARHIATSETRMLRPALTP